MTITARHRAPAPVPFEITAHYGPTYHGTVVDGSAALAVAAMFLDEYAATSTSITPLDRAELFATVAGGPTHVLVLPAGIPVTVTNDHLIRTSCGTDIPIRDATVSVHPSKGIPCPLCHTYWARHYQQDES